MRDHEEVEPQPTRPSAPARVDQPAPGVSRAISDPMGASPASLLELQRLAGNAVVSRLVGGADEAEEAPRRSPVLDVVGKGGGRPLDDGVRGEMEARLGGDFSDVRVHTDSGASRSAEAVDAHAYTVGRDVVFRSDRWNPDSTDGKTTLAHELTHVMQQRSGPVAGSETGDGIRLSDPSDAFEQAAERGAHAAMTATLAPTSAGGPVAAAGAPGAQREATPGSASEEEEEEATAQGEFVQREGEEKEEEEEEEEATAQGEFVQREGEKDKDEEEEEGDGRGAF
jgi:hypothetical protein